MRLLSSPSSILLLGWSLLCQAGASSTSTSSSSSSSSSTAQRQSLRFLEDQYNNANNNNNNQQRDFYGDYHMVFDKCIRVKIPNDNDDAEGNSYFYNGAYRSQSMAYASFFLCPNSNGCDDCDTSTAYVTDLENYLESYVEHLQSYCYSCTQKCRRNRERRLEDEGQQGNDGGDGDYYNGAIDCYECADQCELLSGDGNGGNDESQYLECQEAFEDEDGINYYSAPTCGNDGSIEMGLFYDDECTIKKSDDQTGFKNNFGYNTFKTVENWCTYCDYNGNDDNEVCDNDGAFMEDAYQCVNGQNVNYNMDDDEMHVCKTYKQVSKEWQYASAKKKSLLPFVIAFFVLVFAFLFLSYTYYVRHTKEPSSSSDDNAAAAAAAAANTTSDGGAGTSDANADPQEPKAAYAQLT